MIVETKQALWRALKRFGRVFVASAIAAMALVPMNGIDLNGYLKLLIIAGIAGGLSGCDKFIRDTWLKK